MNYTGMHSYRSEISSEVVFLDLLRSITMFRPCQVVSWLFVTVLVLSVAAPAAFAQGQGRLSGRTFDANGSPLPGVAIKAEKPDANPPLFETTSDTNGRWSLIGFVSGQWSMTASLEGYIADTGTATVRQGTNPPMEFMLSRIPHPLVAALGAEAMEGLDPDAIEAELAAADTAYNSEDWNGAIQAYESLMSKLPMLTNLHRQIGDAHRANGDFEQAIVSYETLLSAEPDNEDAKTQIARTRLAMGDIEGASEQLAVSASSLNASREDLYNLGELEFAKGAVDEAAGWYEKATMIDPNWELPLYKLALVALNKGDMDTAKGYFEKVIAAAPNSEQGAIAKATLDALP